MFPVALHPEIVNPVNTAPADAAVPIVTVTVVLVKLTALNDSGPTFVPTGVAAEQEVAPLVHEALVSDNTIVLPEENEQLLALVPDTTPL